MEDALFEYKKIALNIIENQGIFKGSKNKRKIFKVNEEVQLNFGVEKATILEIKNDIYKVEYVQNCSIPYTNRYKKETKVGNFHYTSLYKKSTKEFTLPSIVKPRSIQFFNMHVSSLIDMALYTGVDFNPSYQRGIVWTKKQKETLLDTIFAGADIGKFLFSVDNDKEAYYTVVDGKQRLSTIVSFYLDEFTYKGFYYSELSEEYRYVFNRLSVSVGQIREHVSEKEILGLFLFMNENGTPIDKKHLERVRNIYNQL